MALAEGGEERVGYPTCKGWWRFNYKVRGLCLELRDDIVWTQKAADM
jgi:hypothetical protein